MKPKNTEQTEQLLIRPRQALVRRLRDLAERYGYDSGNQVAVDVLDAYLDFWVEVKEAERAAREEQRARVLGKETAPSTTVSRRARNKVA